MTKSLTFRNFFLLFLIVFGAFNASSQATFWSENFNTPASFGAWTSANVGEGPEIWKRSLVVADQMGFTGTPAAFSSPTATQGFAFYNSDANGSVTHDALLTSPAINCASHTSVGLRFRSQFADFEGSDVEVRVSTDAGTTWTAYPIFDDQPSYGLAQAALVPSAILTEMAIPAANSQAAVLVQFRWSGFFEYGWKLDDIELYDYVAPTTSVTFRVNVSLVPVIDPAGVRIAGSFNSWTDEVMANAGNGVWTITKELDPGATVQYKFKNGPNGWENVPSACGVSDGFGGYNRQVDISGTDVTLPAVCLSSCAPCAVPCNLNPDAIICDDMETYNVGNISPQSPHWIPWDLNEASAVNAVVSTTFASNGTKSMKVTTNDDQVLQLGDKSSGHYGLKWKQYVENAKAAYINIQTTQVIPPTVPTANFAAQLYFNADKTLNMDIPLPAVGGTYPQAQWFPVELDVDLDNNIASLKVNNVLVRKWAYTQTFGGIDFYSANATNTFYVDEVEYVKLPDVVFNPDNCASAVDLTPYFGGAEGVVLTTGLYNNTTATADPSDPDVDCWNEATPTVSPDGSMWYTFSGDGELYHIETVPCNATTYIGAAQDDPGDTQMAIYTGSCGNYTLVECNDDLFANGMPDWRSAVDVQTVAGQQYYMLIDGYNFGGVVAIGEFCVSVSRGQVIDCDAAEIGAYETINNGLVCNLDATNTGLAITDGSFILPTVGVVKGMCWAISTSDPAGAWPPDDAGFWGSFGVSAAEYVPALPNNGNPLTYGEWWFTPVVIGNGVDGNLTNNGVFLQDIDPLTACVVVGASVKLTLLPVLDPVVATFTSTDETAAGALNGTVTLNPSGGFPGLIGDPSLFEYAWSNGATTQNLTGVAGGTYTVVIADPSGCTDPVTVVTSLSTPTKDPASVKALTLTPNPTSGVLQLNLTTAAATDVRFDVFNTLGQNVLTMDAGKTSNVSRSLDLTAMPNGTYTLRVTMGSETAMRRIVVQR